MIKLNSNTVNISLLECCVEELDKESTNIFDIKETIKEVIESLQNKG